MFGALAQGLGSIVSGIGQAMANKKQRAFDREMYQTQKNDNLEFWNLQNQYNSPEAVMARLKSAGLNPNLAYSQGGDWQTAAPQPATAQNTNLSGNFSGMLRDLPGNMASMINQQYDLRLKSAQTDQLKASAENLGTQSALNTSLKILRDLESQYQREQNSVAKEQLRLQLVKLRTDITNTATNTLKTQQDTRTSSAMEKNYTQNTSYLIEKNLREGSLNRHTLQKINQDIVESQMRVKHMDAQIGLIPTQKAKMEAETLKTNLDTLTDKFDLWLKSHNLNSNSTGINRYLDAFYNYVTGERKVTESEWPLIRKQLDSLLYDKSPYPNLKW